MLQNYIIILRKRFKWAVASFALIALLIAVTAIFRSGRERISYTLFVGVDTPVAPATVVQNIRGRIDARAADLSIDEPSSAGDSLRAINPRGSRYVVISVVNDDSGVEKTALDDVFRDVMDNLEKRDASRRAGIRAEIIEYRGEISRHENDLKVYGAEITAIQNDAAALGALINQYGNKMVHHSAERQDRKTALLASKIYYSVGFKEDLSRHKALLTRAKGRLLAAQKRLLEYQGSKLIFGPVTEPFAVFSMLALILLFIFSSVFSLVFAPLFAEFLYADVIPAFRLPIDHGE